jgi:predicted metal-dependent hydrolase
MALGMTSSHLLRRRVDFDFVDAGVPRDWFAGDAHLTTFLSALSLLFPEGERFFVESVRGIQSRVDDPALRAEIAAFIGQEAMHGRAHRALNQLARDRAGDLVDRLEADLKKLLVRVRRTLTPKGRLAVTCALEHFTAIMAEQLLAEGEHHEALDASVRGLWLWHALEESEHKAVAFDAYEAVGGGYGRRVAIMIAASAVFFAKLLHVHARMLAAQGELANVRGWARAVWHLWGRPGMFRKLVPAYLDYYRPGFHPNDRDTSALLGAWREKLFGDGGALLARLREASPAVIAS